LQENERRLQEVIAGDRIRAVQGISALLDERTMAAVVS